MSSGILIDRVFVGVGFYLPLLSFCFFGAIKELPENPDWLDKDTKNKATMCFIAYGTTFPLMVFVSLCSSGWQVRKSPWHTGMIVLAIAQTILYIITTCIKLYYIHLEKKGFDKNTDPYDVMYDIVPALMVKDNVMKTRTFVMRAAFLLNVIVAYFSRTII